MKVNRFICSGILCIVIGMMLLPLQVQAAGSARLWTLDSAGTKINSKSYTLTDFVANGYERHPTTGVARLLWTKTGSAQLWTLNASGTKTASKTYTLAGFTATSYDRNWSSGVARLLWTKTGSAQLWSLDATGTKVAAKTYTLAGFTATGYDRNWSTGAARLLWTNPTTGKAQLWSLDATGTKVATKTYTFAAGWAATSYDRNWSTSVAQLAWAKSTTGRTTVWTLNASGTKTTTISYLISAGWSGTSYLYKPSATSKTTTAPVEAVAVLTVKKAGSGTGTITAGDQVCDAACQELSVLYVAGKQVDLQVTPAAGSSFAGWETASGVPLENIYYANPGDTVYAIFNQ